MINWKESLISIDENRLTMATSENQTKTKVYLLLWEFKSTIWTLKSTFKANFFFLKNKILCERKTALATETYILNINPGQSGHWTVFSAPKRFFVVMIKSRKIKSRSLQDIALKYHSQSSLIEIFCNIRPLLHTYQVCQETKGYIFHVCSTKSLACSRVNQWGRQIWTTGFICRKNYNFIIFRRLLIRFRYRVLRIIFFFMIVIENV